MKLKIKTFLLFMFLSIPVVAAQQSIVLNSEAIVFHKGQWFLCDPALSTGAIMITINGKTQCVNKADLLGNKDQRTIRIMTPQAFLDANFGAGKFTSNGVFFADNKMVLRYQSVKQIATVN